MRTPLSLTGFLVTASAVLAILACRADQTNMFPHLRFVPVDVRIVDSATTNVVIGAMVYPYCLGGTPYATNSYRTDTNGIARIMAFEHFAAVRVAMGGYMEASVAFIPTNGVFTNAMVSLRRVVK